MTAKQWASNHRELLRWLLKLPVLWRIAYLLITENLPHDESGTACVVCAAAARKKKREHEVTMNGARQLYCKKCGLLMYAWGATPRCSGKKKLVGVVEPPQPAVRVLPINWE